MKKQEKSRVGACLGSFSDSGAVGMTETSAGVFGPLNDNPGVTSQEADVLISVEGRPLARARWPEHTPAVKTMAC